TEAVYKVLDHTEQKAVIPGHFQKHELDAVWSDFSYMDVFEQLLALMENFELCYQLPDNKEEYIVPQLLFSDKPEYEWSDSDQLRLHYKYTFMPKGIVTRLIVRLHSMIAEQATVWQRGAIFKLDGARAEVSERFRDKEIHIKVKGENRKELMTIITHEIDLINSTFDFGERLRVAQKIPCNCADCIGKVEPYFFEKQV
ncbi:MAG: GTPase, partial [Bacteroidetes bacterium]|nr:GTPase [Bacteroidota bacterium]